MCIRKIRKGKRVHKQLEVDFVVNQGNQRCYIQAANDMISEEKQTQELNSLRNFMDSFKKYPKKVCSISFSPNLQLQFIPNMD